MTTKAFAEDMGLNYRTALNWLREGLVSGALEQNSPIGKYWFTPRSALKMEMPKPGPKERTKNVSKKGSAKWRRRS